MITLYGIPNCDTIKKARKWLAEHGIDYQFHDYKKAGIDSETLQAWVRELGRETLVNTRGTTWRKLPEEERAALDDSKAIALMQAQPSLIKRPVLDTGEARLVGFDPARYRESLL